MSTYCPIDSLPDLGTPSADVVAMRKMKDKLKKKTMMKRTSSKFYDAKDPDTYLDVVPELNVPAPLSDVFRASSNSSPASVFDFPVSAPMGCYSPPPPKIKKTVRFSPTRPQKIVYENAGTAEVWIHKNVLKRNREKRARETNLWLTKGHPPVLEEAFYSPRVSDLADFCSLEDEDHMRGAEHYICENHAVTRVKAKNRVVRSVLERMSDLEMQSGKTPKDIADELAALSLTLTDAAKVFARMMGIADAIASTTACEEDEDDDEDENQSSVGGCFSGSTTTDQEILSDVISEFSSASTSSNNSYHDAVEEIVPHPSLLKPRALRVAVPKRVEKKMKKRKDRTSKRGESRSSRSSKSKDSNKKDKDSTKKEKRSSSTYQRKMTGGSLAQT